MGSEHRQADGTIVRVCTRDDLAVGQITFADRTVGKLVAADQWALILEVLHRHLDGHPELLDQILIDLANLPPTYERVRR